MKSFILLCCLATAYCGIIVNQMPNNGDSPSQNRSGPGMDALQSRLYMGFGFEQCFTEAGTCNQLFYNDVYRYELSTQRWSVIAPNSFGTGVPAPRTFMGFGVWNSPGPAEKIIVCNGLYYADPTSFPSIYSDCWSLDTNTRSWSLITASSPLGSRYGVILTVVGNDAYLFGGAGFTFNGFGEFNDMYKLNLQTNTFTKLLNNSNSPSRPSPRDRALAVYSPERHCIIYTLGDTVPFLNPGHPNTTWEYDIATNTFTQREGLDPRTDGVLGINGTRLFVAYGDQEEGTTCENNETKVTDNPTGSIVVNENIFSSSYHFAQVSQSGGPRALKRPGYTTVSQGSYVGTYFFGGYDFDCSAGPGTGTASFNKNLYQIVSY
jgi:hypothetical protein